MKSQEREGFQMIKQKDFKCKRCEKSTDLIVENNLCWNCYMIDIDKKLAWQQDIEDACRKVKEVKQ